MHRHIRFFAAVLSAVLLMTSCSLFEMKEAHLTIEDSRRTDDYKYTITLSYTDDDTDEMVKLGSEVRSKIPLGVDEWRGVNVTVNKIDNEKGTIVSTGSASSEQILGDITVKMRPVGKTNIDLTMTPGKQGSATYGLRAGKKGVAVFDSVYASSGELNPEKEYILVYKGEPKTSLKDILVTIPIKAGKEKDASVTYYLMYEGREIDRITIDGSDYIKNETVKHSLISEALLTYDVLPEYGQKPDDLSTVSVTWLPEEKLMEDIESIVFGYMGSERKVPYEKGEWEFPIDDLHDDMTVTYRLTFWKDPEAEAPVRNFTIERNSELRGIELSYNGQIMPESGDIPFQIIPVPYDAPMKDIEIFTTDSEFLTITRDPSNELEGIFRGHRNGTATIHFRCTTTDTQTGKDIAKEFTPSVSVISSPKLNFRANERNITFSFDPHGDPNVEITLMRKVGKPQNQWRPVRTDGPIEEETLLYTEGSRVFPVWFKAVYRQKNGEGEAIESNPVRVSYENVLPPAPPVDGVITIITPLPGNITLELESKTDTETGIITYTLKDNSAVDTDRIFWQLGVTGEEMEGRTFTFDTAAHTDQYTYKNTRYDEETGKTYFTESLTLFAHDKEGKLFSAETPLDIDVTHHIGGEQK